MTHYINRFRADKLLGVLRLALGDTTHQADKEPRDVVVALDDETARDLRDVLNKMYPQGEGQALQ